MGIPAALLASAILALDPWHISLTRTAHEVGFAPLFLSPPCGHGIAPGILPNPPGFVAFSAPTQRPGILAVIGGILMGALAWVYPAARLFTPIFLIVLAFLGIRNLARFGRSKTGKQALIGQLVRPGDRDRADLGNGLHASRTTRRTGQSDFDLYAAVARPFDDARIRVEPARNIDPGYSFWRCEDMSGMRMPVGQHLLVIAPLFAIGLTRCLRIVVDRPGHNLYPYMDSSGIASCGDMPRLEPHPFRTIALLPVFPIVAAYGGLWLLAVLSKQSHSLRASAVAVATFVFCSASRTSLAVISGPIQRVRSLAIRPR